MSNTDKYLSRWKPIVFGFYAITGSIAWTGVAISVWTYTTVLDAVNPYFPLVGPSVAALFVYLGWRKTHSDAKKRDQGNWQRTEMSKNAVACAQELVRLGDLTRKIVSSPLSPQTVNRLQDLKEVGATFTNFHEASLLVSDEPYPSLLDKIRSAAIEVSYSSHQYVRSIQKSVAVEENRTRTQEARKLLLEGRLYIILATRAHVGRVPQGAAKDPNELIQGYLDEYIEMVEKFKSENPSPL